MSDAAPVFNELIEVIAKRAAEIVVEKLAAGRMKNRRPQHSDQASTTRDLVDEVEAVLGAKPGLTIPELARSLRTRQQTIRQLLRANDRFTSRSCLPGRSPKANGWFLVTNSSPTNPARGTSPLSSTPDGAPT